MVYMKVLILNNKYNYFLQLFITLKGLSSSSDNGSKKKCIFIVLRLFKSVSNNYLFIAGVKFIFFISKSFLCYLQENNLYQTTTIGQPGSIMNLQDYLTDVHLIQRTGIS